MANKIKLQEGGVYGHMSHLHDNPYLTFKEMKEILQKAASGKLEGTEKTDGQNLFISYSNKIGKAVAARNKGNIKTGGLDAAGLAKKFQGRGALEDAFNDAFSAFEQAVSKLSEEAKLRLFGENAEIYYNSEVQDPRAANVINYDEPNLVIHNVGHIRYNKEADKIEGFDLEGVEQFFNELIGHGDQRTEEQRFRIQKNAIKKLKAISDGTVLEHALQKLENEINTAGISDNQTVLEYIIAKIKPSLEGIELPEEQHKLLFKRVLAPMTGEKGLKKTEITKGASPEVKKQVNELIDSAPLLLKDAIKPLETLIHDFAVEVLRGLESAFVLDNKKEVKRLQGKVSNAINAIEASGDEDNIAILQQQMKKLKSAESVSTAAEGFVFDYNGATYKFTGNFAPANQILGLFKYGRKGSKPMDDLFLDAGASKGEAEFFYGDEEPEQPYIREVTEAEPSEEEIPSKGVIVLYPGGFKPPHAGHFELAKRYAIQEDVEKVIMLMGSKKRTSKDGKIEVTKEDSIHIIDQFYKQHLGNKIVIEAAPDGEENPMKAAFKWLEFRSKPGETYALAASSKDTGRAEMFKRGHCHEHGKYCRKGVYVIVYPADTEAIVYEGRTDDKNGKPISASTMREDLARGDKENFKTSLPEKVKEHVDEIYDYLKGSSEESLEELSSMAGAGGGNVEGSPAASGGAWKSFSKEENDQHRRDTKQNENKRDLETNYKYISDSRKKNMSVKELLQEKQKIEEFALRKHIRYLLESKYNKLNEENKLRLIIRNLIKEAAIEDTPSRSTGINKLVSALKIILPTIERAYKSLTTSIDQRTSYKKHLIKAIIDTLSPQDAISGVGDGGEEGVEPLSTEEPAGMEAAAPEMGAEEAPPEEEMPPLQEQADPVSDSPEGIDIEVAGGAGDEDPFRTKEDDEAAAKADEEEKELQKKKDKEAYKDVEGEKQEFPELPGLDETGRDEAVDIYKKIIDAVIRTYRRLHSERDKVHYKDYLVTNLLLYFDKWESDIGGVPDISTPEYEAEKAAKEKFTAGAGAAGGMPPPPAGEEELPPPPPLQETIKKSILSTILKYTS